MAGSVSSELVLTIVASAFFNRSMSIKPRAAAAKPKGDESRRSKERFERPALTNTGSDLKLKRSCNTLIGNVIAGCRKKAMELTQNPRLLPRRLRDTAALERCRPQARGTEYRVEARVRSKLRSFLVSASLKWCLSTGGF